MVEKNVTFSQKRGLAQKFWGKLSIFRNGQKMNHTWDFDKTRRYSPLLTTDLDSEHQERSFGACLERIYILVKIGKTRQVRACRVIPFSGKIRWVHFSSFLASKWSDGWKCWEKCHFFPEKRAVTKVLREIVYFEKWQENAPYFTFRPN